MSFDGKWKAVEFNGGAAYLDAIHASDEYKQKLQKLGEAIKSDPNVYIEEIHVNKAAGTVHRTALINGEKRKDSGELKVGVEVDAHVGDGRAAKAKITHDTENKFVIHEKGDGFEITSSFEVSGDNLTLTSVGNGATFVAKFHRA